MPRIAKPEGTKNARLNITLPPDLNEQLRKYAEEHERPLAWVIQKALVEWLESHQ